jgi:ABC-type transport system involved in cytochrome c biogenesis ATPase subunit
MEKHVADGGMILAAVHGETGLTPNQTIDLGAFT